MKKRVRLYKAQMGGVQAMQQVEQGMQGQPQVSDDQLIQATINLISQGSDPEEAMTKLMDSGIDQQKANQIVSSVVNYINQQDEERVASMEEDQEKLEELAAEEESAREEAEDAEREQQKDAYAQMYYGNDQSDDGAMDEEEAMMDMNMMRYGGKVPSKRTFVKNVMKKLQAGGMQQQQSNVADDTDTGARKSRLTDFVGSLQNNANSALMKQDAEQMYNQFMQDGGDVESSMQTFDPYHNLAHYSDAFEHTMPFQETGIQQAQFGGRSGRRQMRRMNRNIGRMLGNIPAGYTSNRGFAQFPGGFNIMTLPIGMPKMGYMPAYGGSYGGVRLANIDVRKSGLFGHPRQYTINYAQDVVTNPQLQREMMQQEARNATQELKDQVETSPAKSEDKPVVPTEGQVVDKTKGYDTNWSKPTNQEAYRKAEDLYNKEWSRVYYLGPNSNDFMNDFQVPEVVPISGRFDDWHMGRGINYKGSGKKDNPNTPYLDESRVLSGQYSSSDLEYFGNLIKKAEETGQPLPPEIAAMIPSKENISYMATDPDTGYEYSVQDYTSGPNQPYATKIQKYRDDMNSLDAGAMYTEDAPYGKDKTGLNNLAPLYSFTLGEPNIPKTPTKTKKQQGGIISNPFQDPYGNLQKFIYGGGEDISVPMVAGKITDDPYFQYGGLTEYQDKGQVAELSPAELELAKKYNINDPGFSAEETRRRIKEEQRNEYIDAQMSSQNKEEEPSNNSTRTQYPTQRNYDPYNRADYNNTRVYNPYSTPIYPPLFRGRAGFGRFNPLAANPVFSNAGSWAQQMNLPYDPRTGMTIPGGGFGPDSYLKQIDVRRSGLFGDPRRYTMTFGHPKGDPLAPRIGMDGATPAAYKDMAQQQMMNQQPQRQGARGTIPDEEWDALSGKAKRSIRQGERKAGRNPYIQNENYQPQGATTPTTPSTTTTTGATTTTPTATATTTPTTTTAPATGTTTPATGTAPTATTPTITQTTVGGKPKYTYKSGDVTFQSQNEYTPQEAEELLKGYGYTGNEPTKNNVEEVPTNESTTPETTTPTEAEPTVNKSRGKRFTKENVQNVAQKAGNYMIPSAGKNLYQGVTNAMNRRKAVDAALSGVPRNEARLFGPEAINYRQTLNQINDKTAEWKQLPGMVNEKPNREELQSALDFYGANIEPSVKQLAQSKQAANKYFEDVPMRTKNKNFREWKRSQLSQQAYGGYVPEFQPGGQYGDITVYTSNPSLSGFSDIDLLSAPTAPIANVPQSNVFDAFKTPLSSDLQLSDAERKAMGEPEQMEIDPNQPLRQQTKKQYDEDVSSVDFKNRNMTTIDFMQGVNALNSGIYRGLNFKEMMGDATRKNHLYNRLPADATYGTTRSYDRGTYDPEGLFMPDEQGFRGVVKYGGYLQDGGQLGEDAETWMSEDQIRQFLADGGELEFI